MKRPFGITVIAILALIGGLFGLCWPTLVFTGSAFLGPIFGTVGVIAGIFLIVGPAAAADLCLWGHEFALLGLVPGTDSDSHYRDRRDH